MAVKIEVTVECPMVPKFLRCGRDVMVDIKEFTDEQLEQIGKDWTRQLIEEAHKRQKSQLANKAEGE